VRHLVLLNSVGSPRAFAAGGVAGRPGGLNGLTSMLKSLRPAEDLTTTSLMQWTLLANVQRHPFSVMQAAQAALSADLRGEMAVLAARRLPVLVLWSDDDRVIPTSAFDTFCSAFGTDGQMVRGGHSWLLANPETFGEVLDNVISVQGSEHGASAATGNVAQLRTLLEETSVPRAAVSRLLDGVSPLWVMSEPPELLAADLALCHPPVAAGEVRAVARELSAEHMFRLTVVALDRRGFLADTAAVLAAAGVTVETASVMTWPDSQLALHALTVRSDGGMDAARWSAIGDRLRATVDEPFSSTFVPSGRATVTRSGSGVGTSIVRVTAPDDVGLLSAICRWFADEGLSIEAAGIATVDGVASDVFLVDGDCDTGRLARHLSRRTTLTTPCARLLRTLLGTAARQS
jgi:predicted amino acid-binding ACT domain protein